MDIDVSGHHLEITTPLRNYIDDKFDRLERHSDQINSIKVTLTPVPDKLHLAESTIQLTGHEVFASAKAHDMYAAIDQLTDKLDKQIIKHKNKAIDRKHQL